MPTGNLLHVSLLSFESRLLAPTMRFNWPLLSLLLEFPLLEGVTILGVSLTFDPDSEGSGLNKKNPCPCTSQGEGNGF